MAVNTTSKSFRLQAKEFAITYPHCDVSMQVMYDYYKETHKPRYLCVCEELHEDGSPHLHVCAVFQTRKDVKNERFFDFIRDGKTYHPNVKKCKKLQWWDEYVKKGGRFVQSDTEALTFNPMHYDVGKIKKAYQDIQWANHYIEMSQCTPLVYPVQLGGGIVLHKPDPAVKQRNIWFVAVADAGKSYFISKLFGASKVYYLTKSKSQYWFEDYEHEDVIICDDVLIPFADIANVLNTHLHPGVRVAGQVRYVNKYWKKGHTRTMIVLNNFRIEDKYGPLADPMKARFKQYDFATLKELVPPSRSVVHIAGCTSNPCTCTDVDEIKYND